MNATYLSKVYKSTVMRKILEDIKKLSYDNTVVFLYGEKGTEKDYIVKIMLGYMNQPDVMTIPKDLSKKTYSRNENMVYIIKNITSLENIDISCLFNFEKCLKCTILLSDCDYVQLYENGTITFELYEALLNSKKIYIPPLKERKQDIIPLAKFFIQEISEFLGIPPKDLSKDAQEALLEYSWTENTYQLRQCLAKACILNRHTRLTSKDLFGEYSDQLSIRNFLELKIGNLLKDFANIENSNLYETIIQEVEKALLILAINETGGNQVKAAKILGINRNTLNKKLKHYSLI